VVVDVAERNVAAPSNLGERRAMHSLLVDQRSRARDQALIFAAESFWLTSNPNERTPSAGSATTYSTPPTQAYRSSARDDPMSTAHSLSSSREARQTRRLPEPAAIGFNHARATLVTV